MIKIGIIGTGKKLENHLKILKALGGVDITGIFSFDKEQTGNIAMDWGIPFFYEIEELIDTVDGINIIETNDLYYILTEAIKQSKHLFIDNPFILKVKEIENLIKLIHEADVKVQISHPYSLNTAFIKAVPYIQHPQLIEIVNYYKSNENNFVQFGANHYLIYDISLLLCIVNSCVQRIHSHGFSIKGNYPDVVSARIEFGNGSIANITSSRLAINEKHKYLVYQQNELIDINLVKNKSVIYKYKNDIQLQEENIFETNPLNCIMDTTKNELVNFINFMEKGNAPLVSFENFYYALQLSCEIIEKINRNSVQITEY